MLLCEIILLFVRPQWDPKGVVFGEVTWYHPASSGLLCSCAGIQLLAAAASPQALPVPALSWPHPAVGKGLLLTAV